MAINKPLLTESEIYYLDEKHICVVVEDNKDEQDDKISPEERQRLLVDLYDKLSVAEAESVAGDPGISHEDLMNEIRKMIDERGL